MIHLIAGHSNSDPGAIAYDLTTEASLTRELRDKIEERAACLVYSGSTMIDNDNHGLLETILAINNHGHAGLVLDLHFNYNHPTASGVETFYAAGTSHHNKLKASELSLEISSALLLPNRGAKPDTETRFGRLGILRDTLPPAVLLEVCFLNIRDLEAYRRRTQQVIDAIIIWMNNYFL